MFSTLSLRGSKRCNSTSLFSSLKSQYFNKKTIQFSPGNITFVRQATFIPHFHFGYDDTGTQKSFYSNSQCASMTTADTEYEQMSEYRKEWRRYEIECQVHKKVCKQLEEYDRRGVWLFLFWSAVLIVTWNPFTFLMYLLACATSMGKGRPNPPKPPTIEPTIAFDRTLHQ